MSFDAFPPYISTQLQYLLAHFPHRIRVDQAWSGNKLQPRILDRFTLLIPYCLDTVKWDVIYNSEFPFSAPDVVFGPDDEDFNSYLIMGAEGGGGGDAKSSVQSVLSSWSNRDPSRLLNLIQVLRDQYVCFQKNLVAEVDDERVKFEISTILYREGIEMHINSGAERFEEVKFAVPLMDMDINKMVPGCPWRHPQKIYLQVIYPVGKKYGAAPTAPRLELKATPELKALFSIDDVKLSQWSDGMCLAEYLPHLEEALKKQLSEAVNQVSARRSFIEALAPLFGRPLEAEPVFCRKATFLSSNGTFVFLVHFILSSQFPKQRPALLLQSMQRLQSQGVPMKSSLLTEYPWSPRWDASQMAERIFDFLTDESLNFKRVCNESLVQPQ